MLVIIGLIVGGVLAGRNLLMAAQARSLITQIDRYKQAAYSFRTKFGYLPGDLPAAPAAQFGFAARGSYAGQGDGNGVIAGNYANAAGSLTPISPCNGETGMFWVDLTSANGKNVNMVEGRFSAAVPGAVDYGTLGCQVAMGTVSLLTPIMPRASIGRDNYVYVFAGGTGTFGAFTPNGMHYFGVSRAFGLLVSSNVSAGLNTGVALQVSEAQGIDSKMDDGFPQTGGVTAQYMNANVESGRPVWAKGDDGDPDNGTEEGAVDTSATAAEDLTCYDNDSTGGAKQRYSVTTSRGTGLNCALAFRF